MHFFRSVESIIGLEVLEVGWLAGCCCLVVLLLSLTDNRQSQQNEPNTQKKKKVLQQVHDKEHALERLKRCTDCGRAANESDLHN